MKLESLVIAGQHTAVNTFSSLVLKIKCARQRHNLNGENPFLDEIFERSERVGPLAARRGLKDPSSKEQPY